MHERRSPQEVIQLAGSFGLSPHQAQRALSANVGAVLRHARDRKAYRGVLLLRVMRGGGGGLAKESGGMGLRDRGGGRGGLSCASSSSTPCSWQWAGFGSGV